VKFFTIFYNYKIISSKPKLCEELNEDVQPTYKRTYHTSNGQG